MSITYYSCLVYAIFVLAKLWTLKFVIFLQRQQREGRSNSTKFTLSTSYEQNLLFVILDANSKNKSKFGKVRSYARGSQKDVVISSGQTKDVSKLEPEGARDIPCFTTRCYFPFYAKDHKTGNAAVKNRSWSCLCGSRLHFSTSFKKQHTS